MQDVRFGNLGIDELWHQGMAIPKFVVILNFPIPQSEIRNASLCPMPLAVNIDNCGQEPIFLIMSVHFCKVPMA